MTAAHASDQKPRPRLLSWASGSLHLSQSCFLLETKPSRGMNSSALLAKHLPESRAEWRYKITGCFGDLGHSSGLSHLVPTYWPEYVKHQHLQPHMATVTRTFRHAAQEQDQEPSPVMLSLCICKLVLGRSQRKSHHEATSPDVTNLKL